MGKSKPKTRPLAADRSKWSIKSQRTYSVIQHYKDSPYQCRNCGAESVYLAADQKVDFEEKKININTQRVLCSACFKERYRIQRRLAEKLDRWKREKAALAKDRGFISEWIRLLELIPRFAGRKDHARVRMLNRILEKSRGGSV